MDTTEIQKLIRCEFERCMPLFVALGEEVRQQIVLALIDAGCDGLRVGEITEKTRLSRPAISHHLKVLTNAGIIKIRPCGTMNYYFVDVETSLGDFCIMTQHINALVTELKTQIKTIE